MASVEPLQLVTSLFGLKVAKLREEDAKELKQVQDICQKEQVRLLTCRFKTDNVSLAHDLEKHGFQLMDTVTIYRLNFARAPVVKVPANAIIRPCRESEAEDVVAIARAIYVNHVGHYHNDPRLDPVKSTQLYAMMARDSCLDQKVASIMLVAEIEGKIVGFHSHRVVPQKGLEGIISGVSHLAQGKGIGKALILASIDWGRSQGLEWIEQSPHVNNYTMHRMMVDLGFALCDSYYTFHKWFD
jgi:GNAT superfamily N-acetyltransferase